MGKDRPTVNRCGCCVHRTRRPHSFKECAVVWWCALLRREVERDDGCTFGRPEDGDEGDVRVGR